MVHTDTYCFQARPISNTGRLIGERDSLLFCLQGSMPRDIREYRRRRAMTERGSAVSMHVRRTARN